MIAQLTEAISRLAGTLAMAGYARNATLMSHLVLRHLIITLTQYGYPEKYFYTEN